jgi:hypothetical protein
MGTTHAFTPLTIKHTSFKKKFSIMKHVIIFTIALFAICTTSFAALPSTAQWNTPCPTNTVELPAGTIVYLELTEMLESGKATVGQIINFRVKADVVIDGNIVIRTNAVAIGRVELIETTTFNHPEEITIVLTAVQCVDGAMTALHAGNQTFKGRYANEQVIVQPGRGFAANIMNNTKVKV